MSISLKIEVLCVQLGIDINKFILETPIEKIKPENAPPKSSSS